MIEKLREMQLQMIQMRMNLGVIIENSFGTLRNQYEDGDEEEAIDLTAETLINSIKRNNRLYHIICELDDIIEGR